MINSKVLITAGILLILLIIAYIYIGKKESKNKIKKSRIKKENTFDRVLKFLYQHYSKNIITRSYLLNVRDRFELIANNSEEKIVKEVAATLSVIIVLSLTLLIGVTLVTKSAFMFLVMMIVIFILSEIIIEFLVLSKQNKLLSDLIYLIQEIRSKFQETKVVEDAIIFACEEIQRDFSNIAKHGRVIYEALVADEVEDEIEKYKRTAPNKYMELLAVTCYTTMEMGDQYKKNGQSEFLDNLSNQIEEIHIEIQKRETLYYGLQALDVVCLAPIFFPQIVVNFFVSTFPSMERIYSGGIGFLLSLAVAISVFGTYFALRELKKANHEVKTVRRTQSFIKSKTKRKIERLIAFLLPHKMTPTRKRIDKLLKSANQSLTIEKFYVLRVLCSVAFLLFSIAVFITIHASNTDQILNELSFNTSFNASSLSAKEKARQTEITQMDKEIIESAKSNSTYEEILKLVESSTGLTGEAIEVTANRVYEKLQSLNHEYFKWQELLISIFIGIIGYYVPFVYLMIQGKFMGYEVQNEVSRLQSIIMVLMNHERISVYEVLEWLEIYSYVFRGDFENIIAKYDIDNYEAFEESIKSTPYPEFKKILRNLQKASENITIKDAFDELEKEKLRFFKEREKQNERSVRKRISIASTISYIPGIVVVILYIVLPLYLELGSSMESINSLQIF